MRILVSSDGDSLDSYISDDFGHAPFFILIDSESMDYTVIKNEYMNSPEGAGIAAAKAIVQMNVDAVITGDIGMHGYRTLSNAGIYISTDEDGIIRQSIRDFLRRVSRV